MPFSLNEKYIETTEKKLGVKFPGSFRAKMQEANGGEVETPPYAWNLYPFFDTSDKKRIKRTSNDIVRETESARKWTGFPENAIAIGSNGCGDQLVFLRESDGVVLGASVYWWDHETGALNKVSDDFAELVP
jgi:hypothetical protein